MKQCCLRSFLCKRLYRVEIYRDEINWYCSACGTYQCNDLEKQLIEHVLFKSR